MGGQRITQAQQDHYWALRSQGWSIARAAKEAGFSIASAKGFEKKRRNGQDYHDAKKEDRAEIRDYAIPLDEVCDEAKEALADTTGRLFVTRYMGLELSPWQQSGWEVMERAWATGDREFVAENAPPGLGKSTKGVGFACKLIVLDRSVRTLFISRASSLAERNTMRVRRLLERTSPPEGAVSTLSIDFGRFKPRMGGDIWKRDEFVVEQADGTPIDEKEPTCSAFGFDSEWLGNRIDFVFGDDLDSTKTIRNMEIVEKNREIFDNELEARLEPGGLFMIAQQRLGAFDFSNHVLSKVVLPDDDGSEEDPEGTLQYAHVIFKAHYDENCRGIETHRHDSPPYPEGCLLDPGRLPWRDVRKAMGNPQRFKVVYQQEEAAETDALVQRLWVEGGRGPDGLDYPGCWDKDRGAWELPEGMTGDRIGVVTVDPSPTRYWSVQAWCLHPDSKHRFLLDQHRERMEAPDFLEWRHHDQRFTGLGEDWWHNFQRLGVPMRFLIVEDNAAQRFTYQQEIYKRWQILRQVQLLRHNTHRNKADPNYGIQMLAPIWRHGQVRLPGKQGNPGRISSMRLVDEVLRWPNAATDDCVMGQWFLEHSYERLVPPERAAVPMWRPSWLRSAG